MKNVTILLTVLAMLAGTTQAALVDEDFNDDPVGWSYAGDAKDQPATPAGGFGYDDGADAITGTWARNGVTSRYYTGIGTTLDKDSTFTFKCDVTISSSSDNYSIIQVGLLNAGNDNRHNTFVLHVFNDASYGYRARLWRTESGGGIKLAVLTDITADTLYHYEIQYDGSDGSVDAYVWTGDTKPGTATWSSSDSWSGDWTTNAFGTCNYDDSTGEVTGDSTVDNMYLVPEPATMVLLGLGGIGVLIRRRSRA